MSNFNSFDNNNNNEVNLSEATGAEALALLNQVKANQTTTQDPTEILALEKVATGWTVVSDKERALLAQINTLGHREIKTSNYAWERFTRANSNLGIVKSSFGGVVETMIGRGLTSVRELEALFGKHSFDSGEVATIEVHQGLFSATHTTKCMEVRVAVDFDKGKIAYVAKSSNCGSEAIVEPKVRDLRKFAIINFFSDDEKTSVRSLYSVEDTVRLFWALVQCCYTVSQFDYMVAGMTSKLFIDHSEASSRREDANRLAGRGIKPVYGVREYHADLELMSREQIIEAHKIATIPCVCSVGDSTVRFKKSNKEGKLDGTEFKTCYNFFKHLSEPIIIDKQAKKWLCYGNGARASFVDFVKGQLVSASPTDKSAKLLNRIASHSYKQAYNQSVSYVDANGEEAVGEYVKSNLQIALGNKQTCFVEGVETPVFFSFGDFAVNAGTIETNELQNVSFSYSVAKSLSKEVSLKDFRYDFVQNEDGEQLSNSELKLKVQQEVLAQLQSMGNVVNGGEEIRVAGCVVIRNDRHFAIYTDGLTTTADDVKVHIAGKTANGIASTVNVSIKGYARMEGKRSPKLRGNLKKGTAFPTNTVISKAGKSLDWTVLLSSETVKGQSGMAELIANHDNYVERDVVWNKGKLLVDGEVLDVEATLHNLCDTYKITRSFAKDVWQHPTFAPVLEKAKTLHAVKFEGETLTITETVEGFFSWTNFSVEVSTADENAGFSALGSNEQHIVSWFNSSISNNLITASKRNLDKAQHLAVNQFDEGVEVVDISDREAVATLAILVGSGTKHNMDALARKYPQGVKVVGAGFSQYLPFGALLHYGNWDGIFPGSSSISKPDFDDNGSDELTTRNICREVFDFINAINQDWVIDFADTDRVRQLIASLNGIQGWLKDKQSRNASKLLKVESVGTKKKRKAKKFNYHLKVVGNSTIGFDAETKLPVVELNCDKNPSGFKDGFKVLLSRCPLPLFTACVVRHNPSLDNTVVAVNPLIWSASNAGDNDGDLAYLINLFALNGNKVVSDEECLAYNKNYSGLAISEGKPIHWEVFSTSENTRKPYSPLLDNLGEGENQISKFLEMGAVINNDCAMSIPQVSQHYAMGVGEFHKVATATTESIGNKAFSTGNAPKFDEVVALHKAWTDYEEFGLGGWTKDNASVLTNLKAQIQSEIISPGSYKPRGRRGKTTKSSLNLIAIQASALCEIGGKVLRDEAGYSDEAVVAQALKRIAKRDLATNELKLWVEISTGVLRRNPNILDGYRFGEHIKVLGEVRKKALWKVKSMTI